MALYQDIHSQDLLVIPTGINAIRLGFKEPLATKAELNAISLTPGPQGSTGSTGSTGAKGSQGAAGSSNVDEDMAIMLMGG